MIFHRYFLIFGIFGLIVMTLLVNNVVYSKVVTKFFLKIGVVDRASYFTEYSGDSFISSDLWQISFHLYFIILGTWFGRMIILTKLTFLVKTVACSGLFLFCLLFIVIAPPLFLSVIYPFIALFTSLLFYVLIDISFLVLLISAYNAFLKKVQTSGRMMRSVFRYISIILYLAGACENLVSLVLSRESLLLCLLGVQLGVFVVFLPLFLFCCLDDFHFPGLFVLGTVTLYNSSFIDLPFSSYFLSSLWSSLFVLLLFTHALWVICQKPISFSSVEHLICRVCRFRWYCSSGSSSSSKLLEKDSVSLERDVELRPFLQTSSVSHFASGLPHSFQNSFDITQLEISPSSAASDGSADQEPSDNGDLFLSVLLVFCSAVAYCPVAFSGTIRVALFDNNHVSPLPVAFRICGVYILLFLWLIHWLLFYLSLFWRNGYVLEYQRIKQQVYQQGILKNRFLVNKISLSGEAFQRIDWKEADAAV
jgi:hypothetical protein